MSMRRKLKIMNDSAEIVQNYESCTHMAIQKNKLSYFDNLKAICHWHDDIEIIRVFSGEMNFYVNGKVFLLKKDDILIVNSKQLHYGYSEKGADCDFLCALIHPQMFTAHQSFLEKFVKPIINCYALEAIYLTTKDMYSKELLALCDELTDIYLGNDIAKEILYHALSFQIWYKIFYLVQKQHILSVKINNNDLNSQRNMASFIYQNYMNQITLEQIARSGNVCRSKCCKLFNKYLKQSPINFLNEYRIEKSKIFLLDTDNTITKIATQCGFNHLSYFSKLFLEKTNLTPKEFRLLYKNNKKS